MNLFHSTLVNNNHMGVSNKPTCDWPMDKDGLVNISDAVDPPGGCLIDKNVKGFIIRKVLIVDEFGHPVDADIEKYRKCIHKNTQEYIEKYGKKESNRHGDKTMINVKSVETHEMPKQYAQTAPIDNMPDNAAPVTGNMSVPSTNDISRVAANAGGGTYGILMAIIAILGGGGAIWKYLQNKDKSKIKQAELDHELKMKELEVRTNIGHTTCDLAIKEIETKINSIEMSHNELKNSLSNLKEHNNSFSSSSNAEIEEKVEEIEERVTKIERNARARQ